MTSSEPKSRRETLILKAQELFAEKGIDAVSLNEINKAAKQKNTSALHYHFGNKQGLIDAVIYGHYAAIDKELNQRLDQFEALPAQQQTCRALIGAIVHPFAAQLDTSQGINYLKIVSQVFMKSSDMVFKGHPGGEDTARLRGLELLGRFMRHLPPGLIAGRQVMYNNLLFYSLAYYAQTNTEGVASPLGTRELFVNNLIDSLEAVLTAPASSETSDALDLE